MDKSGALFCIDDVVFAPLPPQPISPTAAISKVLFSACPNASKGVISIIAKRNEIAIADNVMTLLNFIMCVVCFTWI